MRDRTLELFLDYLTMYLVYKTGGRFRVEEHGIVAGVRSDTRPTLLTYVNVMTSLAELKGPGHLV